MEVYIKKYFWLLGVIVVILCSTFTAKAVNHYVEAKYLADSAENKKESPQRPTTAKKQTKSKIGEPLAKRNMFCSDCLPPEPTTEIQSDGTSVPMTSLPLRLVATNLSSVEAESFATILNTTNDKKGSYAMATPIPEAGEIVRIRSKYVDFKNDKTRRVERISLLAKSAPKRASTKTASKPARTTANKKKAELAAELDEGINKVDDKTFEIDRSLVDKVLTNPTAVARGARIVPSIKNGKPNGFKLYAIRPSSVYAKIGLMNGDTIQSINGFELTTPDKALEVYTKVREANSISVTATRRGKPITLNYTIK